MKLKLFLIALFLLILALASRAQTSSFAYRGLALTGALNGSSGPDWQLQTIQGVSHKTYFAGVGLGIDNYFRKTIPVFIDFRKEIFQKKQTPFLYLDLGISLPSDKRTEETLWIGKVTHRFKDGYYYDVGAGYILPVKGRFSLVMSLGYSQKSLGQTSNYSSGGIIRDPYGSEDYNEHYKYTLRRLSLKMGVSF